MKNYHKLLKSKRITTVLSIALIGVFSMGCEDFIEIDVPRNEIVAESVFSTDETVESALRGVYVEANLADRIFNSGLEQLTGIASDEVINLNISDNNYHEFFNNNVSPENDQVLTNLWQNGYRIISLANPIIENLPDNSAITPGLRDQALGEALFFRAFTHFYLVNLFGDIPYADTSDVQILNTASREPVPEVYEKIIDDLVVAHSLMVNDYSHANGNRIRFNQNTATALLARIHLYLEDWGNAEREASELINNPLYVLETDFNNIFIKDSRESIFQFDVPEIGGNGIPQVRHAVVFNMFLEGFFSFLQPGSFANSGAYAMTEESLAAFETEDLRFTNWVGIKTLGEVSWNFPLKYKRSGFNPSSLLNPHEDFVIFRLAEQYLIRAEARVQQGDILGATEDLNVIRNRAGLANTTALDKPSLLAAIIQERRIEFFVEGGHRWMDLKRTNTIDEVLGITKSGWQPTDALFPIPQQELFNNSKLTQNPGY